MAKVICGMCGREVTRGVGYEYDAATKTTTHFCEKCTKVRNRNAKYEAWQFLRQHFEGNATYGISHDRSVVKAANVVRSGWAGDTFIMISSGRKMVRFWHKSSKDLPKHAARREGIRQ